AAQEVALGLVREQFHPPGAPDAEHLRALIKELDDSRYEVRQRAAKELEQFDERSDALLRAALAGTTSAEVRRQLVRLLQRREAPTPRPSEVVAARVLELLEQLANPEAREMLQRFADGPDTPLTRDAKASLRRLNGKP